MMRRLDVISSIFKKWVIVKCNSRNLIGLVAMVYESLYQACPTNMVSVLVNFWGRFYFHFSLVFHNFERFLMKQLFDSRLLGMR